MYSIRQEQMRAYIEEKNVVTIKELQLLFPDVSLMTIHRDLDALQKSGTVVKFRGGAKSVRHAGDPEFNVRMRENNAGKNIIARKALEMEKILVVDEAYGEYIPFGSSAINLVKEFPNVLVTRSFSKGWGMAGVRLGYGVASRETDLLEQLEKLVLPFNSNAVARTLAESALKTKLQNPEDPFGIWPVIRNKQRLLDKVEECCLRYGRSLKVAHTHFSTPILMLYYDGQQENFHLARHLMKHGILTVSCETYEGVGPEAVRIMLPESGKMPLLLKLLEQAIADLPE